MSWEFDDSEVQGGLADEGQHRAYLQHVELGRSAKGEEKANLTWQRQDGGFLCYDTIMLEGRGLGMGLEKLQAIGVAHHDIEAGRWHVVDVEEWLGRSCLLTVKHGEWNGKPRCEVDINSKGCGYQPLAPGDDETPPPDPSPTDDDIPF